MIRKNIYLLGVKIRNDLIWEKYEFLKKSEKWTSEELQEYQRVNCYELLNWAYNKSAFYKKKYDTAGIRPAEFKSLKDLSMFPIVTKTELLKNKEQNQIKAGFKKLMVAETSGSTGQPMVFYKNKEWDAQTRAAMFRGYSWYNVEPWERNGYFWGFNIDKRKALKIKLLDFLQNRFRVFSYDKNEIRKFVNYLRDATYLEGYSSMIYEVAKIVNELNIQKDINLKLIKGTSEKIYDSYQKIAKEAFGNKITSEYGAAESGLIAFECNHGRLHISMENVIVEEIGNEIIVTNLLSRSFPIIRYKLGDYIEIDKKTKCKCGMEHHIIKDVLGRVGNVIYGYASKYPSLVLYYIFKNLAMEKKLILNYQAIQNVAGKIDLRIEQTLRTDEKEWLVYEIKKYFEKDIEVNINEGASLSTIRGKKMDFISSIKEN